MRESIPRLKTANRIGWVMRGPREERKRGGGDQEREKKQEAKSIAKRGTKSIPNKISGVIWKFEGGEGRESSAPGLEWFRAVGTVRNTGKSHRYGVRPIPGFLGTQRS